MAMDLASSGKTTCERLTLRMVDSKVQVRIIQHASEQKSGHNGGHVKDSLIKQSVDRIKARKPYSPLMKHVQKSALKPVNVTPGSNLSLRQIVHGWWPIKRH